MEDRDRQAAILAMARKMPAAMRADFLERACQEDIELCRRVKAELAKDAKAPQDTDDLTVMGPEVALEDSAPGGRVGPYRLLQRIGTGGCGTVWMAEQEEPVRRRVALKVIKLGMDTKEVVARFEAERQALALMDHPSIAKVLDAGATEHGRPYFVMELVRGVSLTGYCDQNQLTTEQRLRLFIQACQAIQHAHQKGIIHRDIKPSNILVTLHNGEPVPKVIDFGIAKAISGQKLTDKTLFTAFEQFIGTPAYTSPEQAEMSSLDVDTRSDIYSLGVLLYELLTGQTPFDAHQLLQAGLDGMRRTIREQEPERPSTRLSALQGDNLTTTAKRRKTEPQRLLGQLRGELDWVVMKCLEKDRTRRYDTASALAQDLERYLRDEPVAARPPSQAYRLRKALVRNKFAFAAAGVVVAALTSATLFSTWRLSREEQARRAEQAARAQAQQAADEAKRQQAIAQHNADESNQRLVRRYLDKGVQLLDRGDFLRSLLWLTEALQLRQSSPADEELHRIRLAAVLKQCPQLVQVWFDEDHLNPAAFSPDGRLVLRLADGTLRAWDVATGEAVDGSLKNCEDAVLAFGVTRGRVWVLSNKDREAPKVLDAFTGEALTPPLTDEDWLKTWLDYVELRSGQRLVAAGFKDGTAEVWEVDSRKPIAGSTVMAGEIQGLALAPNGRELAAIFGAKTNMLGVWSLPSLPSPEPALALAPKPAGESDESPASDPAQARPPSWVRPLEGSAGAGVSGPFFDLNGRRVLVASASGEARAWESLTGVPVGPPLRHGGPLTAAAFAPDGRQAVTAGSDGFARTWDVETGGMASPPLVHPRAITRAAFAPNGQLVLTCGEDAARLWALRRTEALLVRLSHPAAITSLAFSPDGRALLSCAEDGAARVWDLGTGRLLAPPLHLPKGIRSGAFSADGKRVVTVNADHTARIWDTASGRSVYSPLKHDHPVTLASFAADGSRMVTAASWIDDRSTNTELNVWQYDTGERLRSLVLTGAPPVGLDFEARGKQVRTVHEDGRTGTWEWAAGATVAVSTGRAKWHAKASFTPDLRREVRLTGTIARIYDSTTEQAVTPAIHHRAELSHAQFSPNGRMLATVDTDATVAIWEAATGDPITPPMRFNTPVLKAVFAPDNGSLAVVADCGAVWIWPLKPCPDSAQDLVRYARMLTGYRLDETGTLTPIDADELKQVWESVRQSHPPDPLAAMNTLLASHQQEAAFAEINGLWPALRRHLNLVRLPDPTNWTHSARIGLAHVNMSQWPAAAAEFQQTLALGAPGAAVLPFVAVAHLAGGATNDYAQACVQLLAVAQKETSPGFAQLAAWICALGPLPANAIAPALDLAEANLMAHPQDPRALATLGALHYRAGQYDLARQHLAAALVNDASDGAVFAGLFLAMVEAQQNKKELARKRFNQAYWQMTDRRDATTGIASTDLKAGGTTPRTGATIPWEEQVEFEIVAAQARLLCQRLLPESDPAPGTLPANP